MSQVLSNNSLHPKVGETLPGALNYKNMPSANSIIVDRKSVRQQPLSGSVFGYTQAALQQIQFRLNHPDLIDPETVRLNFFHQAYNDAGAEVPERAAAIPGIPATTTDPAVPAVPAVIAEKCAIDDMAQSLIDNIVTRVGSQELDRVDDYGTLANALTYYSMPAEYYRRQANACEGAYKYGGDATALASAQESAREGKWYSIPLHLGVFRQGKMLPPSMDVSLEINLDAFAKCHVVEVDPSGAATTANAFARYDLKYVHLTFDVVSLHPSWYSAYEKAIRSGSGISLPLESYSLVPTVVNTDNGSFLVKKAVTDMRTMLTLFRVQTDITNRVAYSKSVFRRANLKSYQIKMAGKNYPVDPADTVVEMYQQTQMGFSQLSEIDAGGLVDYNAFNTTADQGLFLIAQNFETSRESAFSGINTAERGYQLDFYYKQRADNSTDPHDQGSDEGFNPSAITYQASNYIHSMIVLDLKDSRMSVSQ